MTHVAGDESAALKGDLCPWKPGEHLLFQGGNAAPEIVDGTEVDERREPGHSLVLKEADMLRSGGHRNNEAIYTKIAESRTNGIPL
jgi:hypothetical protein